MAKLLNAPAPKHVLHEEFREDAADYRRRTGESLFDYLHLNYDFALSTAHAWVEGETPRCQLPIRAVQIAVIDLNLRRTVKAFLHNIGLLYVPLPTGKRKAGDVSRIVKRSSEAVLSWLNAKADNAWNKAELDDFDTRCTGLVEAVLAAQAQAHYEFESARTDNVQPFNKASM